MAGEARTAPTSPPVYSFNTTITQVTDRDDQDPCVGRLGLRRRNLPERDPCFRPGQAVLVKTAVPIRRRGWIKGIKDRKLVVEFAGGAVALVATGDVSGKR